MSKQPPMTKRPGNKSKSSLFDQCQTPAYALDPIWPILPKEWVIWEPFAGNGNIVHALRARDYTVVVGDLVFGMDFFANEPYGLNLINHAEPLTCRVHWDCIVSNPPYSIKPDVIERCYNLGKPWALLMPVQTVDSQKTQDLFDRHGVQYYYVDRRVNFEMPLKGLDGNGAQFMTQWFLSGFNLPHDLNYYKTPKGWNK